MNPQYVQLKAKHFKDASFQSIYSCPFSNALQEHFDVGWSSTIEYIDGCVVNNKVFKHEAYGYNDYLFDNEIAIKKDYNDDVIRTIEIIQR